MDELELIAPSGSVLVMPDRLFLKDSLQQVDGNTDRLWTTREKFSQTGTITDPSDSGLEAGDSIGFHEQDCARLANVDLVRVPNHKILYVNDAARPLGINPPKQHGQ